VSLLAPAGAGLSPVVALTLMIGGCSGPVQRIGQDTAPRMSPNASDITLYRARSSWDSFFYMFVLVDGVQVARLDQGERISFSLEPGTYELSYSLGATECEKKVKIEPRRGYLFRLAPSCVIERERG
jgi:hypothetical protein